jgi:Aerotolerance regulator N-terminal/von Willebrand factor type A domain
MSFLYPAFLIGAVAVAIPIVLHLLRRDVAPEVPFTAVRLLRRTPLEQTRRRRLRDLLLLLARVAALLLLAAAFARPYFAHAAGETRLHVVAIDRSFSMGAPGRFERAIALARAAIDSSGRGDRVAVVAFDDRADVIAAPGTPAEARSALDGLKPGYGATRYAPVVHRAIELADQGSVRLSVIGDLQRGGWEDEEPLTVPAGLELDLQDAGAPSRNAAVAGIRRDPDAVIATIRNAGSETRTGTTRVFVDGRVVASAPFSAAGNSAVDVPIKLHAPDRGELAVEIDDPDGYAADDKRYLALDPRERTHVLVVGGDGERSGFYLTRALQAAGGDDGFEVRVVSGRSLSRMDAKEFSQNGAVLILSTRNLDRRAREMLVSFVRAGGGMLVAAAPDVEPSVLATAMGWTGFSAVEQPADVVLAATDVRHPILRPFGPLAVNLGQVRFNRTWRVRDAGWDVVARFTDGSPALLERRDAGRVVLFASDLDRRWNDFPLHPGFVPFTVETVRHITAFSDGRRDYTVADAPKGAKPEPGTYPLDGGRRRVAVNVDARESATSRTTPEEFKAMLQPVASKKSDPAERLAQQSEAQQNLWRYGLMLMLGALVAESVLGRVRS